MTLHLAYAEASIMMIETLLLALISRQVVSTDEIIAAIEDVIETKRHLVEDDDHSKISTQAIGVLSQLANSLAASRIAPP